MKTEIKNYIKYFIKSNRRVIILESVIMFILIPFMVYNTNSPVIADFAFDMFMAMSILCMCTLTIITPLYMFRYLHKKQSCDLYFSLPIKRNHQFLIQFVLGALLALVPLYVNGLLTVLMIAFKAPYLIVNAIGFFITLTIVFLIVYAFFTLLVIKCNTLLDSIIVSSSYIVLPLIAFLSIALFLSSQASQIFVSNIDIVSELIGLEKIVIFMGFPFIAMTSLAKGAMDLNYISIMEIVMDSLLWIFIGALCFYLARRAYIGRKEEDAEQRTTARCTYPFIILVITFSLILVTFSANYWNIPLSILIFVLYIIMIFFANRKIRLEVKNVIVFVIIYVLAFGFVFAFQKTKAFGVIKEVPSVEKVTYAEVELSEYKEPILNEETGEYIDKSEYKVFKIKGAEKIEMLIDLQEEMIDDQNHVGSVSVTITYVLKDKRVINRRYNIMTKIESSKIYRNFTGS